MQRHMQPDAIYGQTDAMELTPSVASFASSQQRNMSREGLGADASADKSAQHASEPRFGDGFEKEQAQVHFQSNDSIMNPKIQAATVAEGEGSNRGDASQPESARENSNIHILEQYPQSHREDGSAPVSARQPGAKPAIISLTELQSQYNNNQSSRSLVAPEDQQAHKQSGYFGSQNERSVAHHITSNHSQSYKPLDFQHIDQEEQYLDEQYRQLNQHQRAPAAGSKLASSRMLPPASFDAGNSGRNMSVRVTQGAGSSSRFSRGNSIAGTISHGEQTGRNMDLPRSRTPSETGEGSQKQYMSQPAMSGGLPSSRRAAEQQHSMSQQSLLNRNTSPFNQPISNTNSEQQPAELQMQSKQKSATSTNHHDQPLSGNDEIYKKLQTKIKQQAERLILLQKAANTQQPNNSEEIEQLKNVLKAKDETIKDMQLRNVEIAKGMMSQSQMKERLAIAEENLRMETAVNEEQRAQIAILKQGIEANLQRLGLRFSPGGANQTGSLSQIDGYLQLMRYSQINEKQHSQIQTLNDQLAHFDERHLNALKEANQAKDREITGLRADHQEQLRAKQRILIDLESKSAELKTQKDELLDFVEQNQAKTKQLEERTHDLSSKFDALVLEKDAYKSKYDDLVKQKKNQDELLEQVKQNLQDMRSQREQLNGEVGALKRELVAVNQELSQSQDVIKDKEAEISQLNGSLADKDKLQRTIEEELNTTVDGKKKELNGIRTKMEIWQESLTQKDQLISQQRAKITELKNRQFALEETNEQLKKTLKGSQGELVGLVEAHELLTQKHDAKSQDGLLLTAEVSRLKQEVAEKKLLIEKFQARLSAKDQELKHMQSTLGDRDRAHLDHERSFREDLRHRDESTHDLLKRTKQLESRLADQAAKLGYLEKVRQDYATQEKHLKQTIEMKQETANELKRELTSLRNECTRQAGLLEQTLSEQAQTKDQREMRMTQQIDAMSIELKNIKEEKQRLDQRLAERAKKYRELEYNEQRNERQTSKQRDDIARLEAELNKSKEQAVGIISENEALNKEKLKDKERIVGLEMDQELMIKTINKIETKLAKFCKQISRVENLDKKYASLSRVVEEHEQMSEEQDAQKTLESIQKCFDLVQSQVKNLIILHETAHSDTSFEAKLDLIQQDKIPQRDTALLKQKSVQSIGNVEHLKTTIQDQESHLKIEKDIKYQYEICLNAVSQMLCLKSEFRQLLVTMVQGLKNLYQHKQESRTISMKLLSSEQRYNEILSDSESDKLFKNQMISLKQNIEKDRLQLNHLERKINSEEDELANQLNELIRIDKAHNEENRGSEVKMRALEARLQEMKNNFEEANSKKDWVEAKLQEIEQQMILFQVNDSGTSNQLSHRSNRSQRRNISTRKQDRPSSAWSDQRSLNHPLPPSAPPRERFEAQNKVNGEEQQIKQQLQREQEELHSEFRINRLADLNYRDACDRRPPGDSSEDPRVASRNNRELQDVQGGSTLTMRAVEPRAQNTSATRSSQLLGFGSNHNTRDALQSNERNLRTYASLQPHYNPQIASSRQPMSHQNLQSDFGKALSRQLNQESGSQRFEDVANSRREYVSNFGDEQLRDSLQKQELSSSPQQPGATSHKRAPTELSVRNILMQKFTEDGGVFGDRTCEDRSRPQEETAVRSRQETSMGRTSNKYKRGLTASRSPYRNQSNEKIPVDIHQYPRNEYVELNNQNMQGHGNSARSDEYLLDSIGAASIPYKHVRQPQVQDTTSPRSRESRSQDRSQELQWSGPGQVRGRDYSGEGAEAQLNRENTRPLRGPRSPSKSSNSKSPLRQARHLIGSNKSKQSSNSPRRPTNDLSMPAGCYLLPLQRNDQYPSSYIQTEDVNTREKSAQESFPLSFVQTNESRHTNKPFASNPAGFAENKFDKIDSIRLQNQLSNEKSRSKRDYIGE